MERFKKITCLGRSKHADKIDAAKKYDQLSADEKKKISKQEYINDALRDRIYSYKTYETYARHNNYFFDFCEKNYNCKTLEQCRDHADEWLQLRIGEGKSAYTVKLELAALCKLYGEPAGNFIPTPDRNRSDITRSRGDAARDYGFSEKFNAELINFCRGTGLRRNELEHLRGDQLIEKSDGNAALLIKGKGGRWREAPIIGGHKEEIISRCRAAGDGLVWERVPSHMDVHSYRADYATAIYNEHARDLSTLDWREKYYCRGDRKGDVFDRAAMAEASAALGHNRLDVVAGHYIRS